MSKPRTLEQIMRSCAADLFGDPSVTFMEDIEERILAALTEARDAERERCAGICEGRAKGSREAARLTTSANTNACMAAEAYGEEQCAARIRDGKEDGK